MPKYAYLIDLFPSIAMAFDFRKLRSAYSGNAIKVLRTSDNTEQDFPFVANKVVGADVLNFVGWNLSNWSEDLTQLAWVNSNLTIGGTLINDPLGIASGRVAFETVANSTHGINKAVTGVTGATYTVFFWLKSQGRDNVRITTSAGLNSRQAWLDLSSGTIVSQPSPFVNLAISSAGNGWYLISFTEVATDVTLQTIFNFSPNGSTLTYVGDVTKGVAIWGYQITESSSILNYRKTTANPEGYGSLSKAYDQATGGNDVINSTIIRQPIIVNGGKLISDGGKLALQGGATLGLISTGTVALSAYSELFFTFGVNVNDVTTAQNLFESSSNYNNNNGAFIVFIQSGLIRVSQRRTSATPATFMLKDYPISTGRQLITVRFRTGQTATNASQVWINGVEITGTVVLNNPSITLSNQVIYLFARNANTLGFLGKYQNFTMFTDPTQRIGIEKNINDYYGYY